MKSKKTTKTDLKLSLHRETLLALEPPEVARVVAGGVTSACRSGWTCCDTTCSGTC
ncbi:MAG: hypothetical protein QOF89_4421 [Acidobacteriota bacterium]|jgi:hypothetical protein|nr:hypothetical protein [Acidobacteriota bacterium]